MGRNRGERDQFYDERRRDKAAKRFYNSKAWDVARTRKLRHHPVCERCRLVFAQHVHHIKPLAECTPRERTAQTNLKAVCQGCHNAEEAEARARAKGEAATPDDQVHVAGMLQPVEDETWFFDAAAADKVVRFIERLLKHFQGTKVDQPFIMEGWQRDFTRTLFGWKSRATKRRRFRKAYLIGAKGMGKTPLLAAIGLFLLLADGEAGAQVISIASTYKQARLTFEAAQKFLRGSDESSSSPLLDIDGVEVQERIIKGPRHGIWSTVAGKPTGRSGPQPSAVIADEIHEWSAPAGKSFDLLCANLFKRSQPILLQATNAGADKNGIAWRIHKHARDVLAGKVRDDSLLPCIFEADRKLDWRSEEAARAANPSIGSFVDFRESVEPEQRNMSQAEYERLFLARWVSGGEKFISMAQWESVASEAVPQEWTDVADGLYVGVDLSQGDDLCAVVYVYVTAERYLVRSSFWLPARTAQEYQEQKGYPFSAWADAGDVYLLEDETISEDVQERIAAEIVATHAAQPVTAVCYDRAYSSHCIAALEAAGLDCRKIGQAWGVANGTAELKRRVQERSIAVEPNDVMRFCASNVEVEGNKHGDVWPVKPMAKGSYAGTRAAKIDGITALVTALTEARKHRFPDTKKKWRGRIVAV